MTIKKIISSGQTGADQAALDVAIKLGIPHGGWIPKDHKAGDDIIPEKYRLHEMPFTSHIGRIEKNVLESDATLIISYGELAGGPALTRKLAMKNGRNWLHMDLNMTPAVQAVSIISSWIRLYEIEILNVTGPKASKEPKIYQDTMNLLEKALCVNLIKDNIDEFLDSQYYSSQIVEDVVNQIVSELSLKQKVVIANLMIEEIETLQYAIDLYISSRPEMNDMDKTGLFGDKAYTVIMKKLWSKLQKTHKLRIIKG